MSGILQAIGEQLSRLNRKDQEIARFVLAQPGRITSMSITDLASESQASTASVSRFCKAFHFSGFTDFKMKLAAELALQPTADSYQDIVAGNPLDSIINAIEANHLRSIADTTRLLDLKQLEAVIAGIRKADRIDLYGVATSGIVAQDFCQKLVRVGKLAQAFTDSHMQITSAANLDVNDMAFAISYSGETGETVDSLRCAKERGALTVSLTRYGTNTLASIADLPLFTSSLEAGMRRGDMASRIAMLHVIDILFIGLISDQFDKYVPRLEQSYQMVRKYRRHEVNLEKGERL